MSVFPAAPAGRADCEGGAVERCVALPYLTRALTSSETHAVNPKLCAPPRAVKIMTFFFHILPERVFCEGSRANLRSILDPTPWASFPWGISSAHQAKNSSKSAGLWQQVQGCSAAKWTQPLVSQDGQGSTSSVPRALRSAQDNLGRGAFLLPRGKGVCSWCFL